MRSLLAAAVLALTLAAPARAGTYDVWSCAGPSGEPLPAHGWSPQSRNGTIHSTCGRPSGAMAGALNAGDVSSGSFSRWTFEAPSNTTIAQVTVNRTTGVSGLYGYWQRSYFLFRDSPVLEQGYALDACAVLSGPCPHPGEPTEPLGAQSEFSSGALRSGRVIASAQCDGAGCPAQPAAVAGWFQIHRARITLADAFPPSFRSAPTGSLLDTGAIVSGNRSVTFDAADLGGGVRFAEVVADGESVARTDIAAGGRCQPPYSDPVPCPLTAQGAISLDTAAVTNGVRRIQVALIDAAGNRTLSDPLTVHVHNDHGPNGTPPSRQAKLTASFRPPRRRARMERLVDFGARVPIRGRLVDGRGEPIAGAALEIYARVDRLGAEEQRIGTTTTGTNGRFSWRTPPGPSRFIRIAYRSYASDERPATTTDLKLDVRPAIALNVRPARVRNGGRIHFRGRLVGGPGRAGVQVLIEAVGRRGRGQVPVATLRADGRGRFRFSYRFLRSFAPFTYRFRARLIPQAAYPYAGGSSRVVLVRIVR